MKDLIDLKNTSVELAKHLFQVAYMLPITICLSLFAVTVFLFPVIVVVAALCIIF